VVFDTKKLFWKKSMDAGRQCAKFFSQNFLAEQNARIFAIENAYSTLLLEHSQKVCGAFSILAAFLRLTSG
jgi:hypothetical protein